MSASDPPRRPATRALSELVAGVLAPVSGKRAFAAAELAAAWPEIVGARYADCTCPDRIDWPRAGSADAGATLRVRADGPRAVLLQHELGQLVERVNGYFGHGAVARIRLVQGMVPRKAPKAGPPAQPADEARVAGLVSTVGDDALRGALARLGRGIFTEPVDAAGQRRDAALFSGRAGSAMPAGVVSQKQRG